MDDGETREGEEDGGGDDGRSRIENAFRAGLGAAYFVVGFAEGWRRARDR